MVVEADWMRFGADVATAGIRDDGSASAYGEHGKEEEGENPDKENQKPSIGSPSSHDFEGGFALFTDSMSMVNHLFLPSIPIPATCAD